MTSPLLEVKDLEVDFKASGFRKPPFRAVDGVSFYVMPGETVGVVGESGSGKSTIGRAVLGLVDPSHGSVRIEDRQITEKTGTTKELAAIRQVVFQDPYSSLNPTRTIGRTLTEPLEVQQAMSPADAKRRIDSLLSSVKLPADASSRFPHSFSGGQRQRVAIARSLAASPELVICDEAVSALDLITRAQVLNLLADLQRETGVAYLFIAHDLPLVTYLSKRVIVLYRGRIMEQGPAAAIEGRPLHPYTVALQAAVLVANPALQRRRREEREATTGASTAAAKSPPPMACPFAPRCPSAADVCWSRRPTDIVLGARIVACHKYDSTSGHPETLGRAELAEIAAPGDPGTADSAGSTPVGSASVGGASVGSSSVGPAAVSSTSAGPPSVGGASVGSSSVGPASIGPAEAPRP